MSEDADSPLVDADAQEIRPPDPRADTIRQQYLTSRAGMNLREEVVTPKGRAKSWGDAVDAFKEYVWKQYKAANTWDKERGIRPTSHRFTSKATEDRYGRSLGVDRAAYRLWGDDLTTVHVVRRARPFGVDGQPQPPADHLDDLLTGNSAVYDAYRRHIEEFHGLTYARLSVLEPHRNGYSHIHDGLWIEDPDAVVSETDICPALDAHLRAVDQAQPRNHGPDAVDVRHAPEVDVSHEDPPNGPTSALPRELVKYLAGLAPHGEGDERNPDVPNVLQAATGPLRFYALLWATGRRQWRPDRTVFKHLVESSQKWYENEGDDADNDAETYPTPKDVDSNSGASTVNVEPRNVTFEKHDGGTNETA